MLVLYKLPTTFSSGHSVILKSKLIELLNEL